jgi:hypothetical protein
MAMNIEGFGMQLQTATAPHGDTKSLRDRVQPPTCCRRPAPAVAAAPAPGLGILAAPAP